MQAQTISIIVPAWNESALLAGTLQSIGEGCRNLTCQTGMRTQLIVVDDGSRDSTAELAVPYADLILRQPARRGKGAALRLGWRAASGEVVVFLDADLGSSAKHWPVLIQPLLKGEYDMTVAKLPQASRKGGFGLVRGAAAHGVRWLSGYRSQAPLSGQRAVRSEILHRSRGRYDGFGVEVGLLIDAVKMGYRVQELEVPLYHRETGRNWSGWWHRGKQLAAVSRTLWACWRKPVC